MGQRSHEGNQLFEPRARRTLLSFIQKETRHILRDRQTLAILLALPLVMVLLFGYAIRTDVQNVRVIVVDAARDGLSTELTRALQGTPALRLVGHHTVPATAEYELRAGRADVVLLLPSDFGRRLSRGTAEVMILTDGSNPNFAQTTEAYVRTVVDRWAAQQAARGTPALKVAVRMRFNPTLESQNLLVPGLLAFVLALISALMTAISISREKERGNLEILFVSPLRPIQIIVGKVVPYLVLAFVNAISTLAIAWVVFRVPFRGSMTLLLVASLVYVLVALSIGVFISVRMPDQRTAMMATLLGLLFPTLILSGFVFPIASLPVWLQPLSKIVPATYYIVIARGVMLKGAGLNVLWQELIVLAGMAAVLIVVSARSLRDRL